MSVKSDNRQTLRISFDERLDITEDGHHLWMGSYQMRDTPTCKYEGRNRSARVLSYFLSTGEWPTQRLRSKCGVSSCVKFEHLCYAATMPKGTEILGYCLHGHPRNAANSRLNSRTGRVECRACARRWSKKRLRKMRETTPQKPRGGMRKTSGKPKNEHPWRAANNALNIYRGGYNVPDNTYNE